MKYELKVFLVFILLIALILIFFIIWGIDLFPKQYNYTQSCKKTCYNLNMDYKVNFASTPWSLNGECICLKQNKIEIGEK